MKKDGKIIYIRAMDATVRESYETFLRCIGMTPVYIKTPDDFDPKVVSKRIIDIVSSCDLVFEPEGNASQEWAHSGGPNEGNRYALLNMEESAINMMKIKRISEKAIGDNILTEAIISFEKGERLLEDIVEVSISNHSSFIRTNESAVLKSMSDLSSFILNPATIKSNPDESLTIRVADVIADTLVLLRQYHLLNIEDLYVRINTRIQFRKSTNKY